MQFTINPFTHRLDAFEQSLPGAAQIETLTGDTGGPVTGTAVTHNVNILGGPGIDVNGNAGTNTLTISLNGGLEGTGTTIGATTADLITFPLGAIPGVYIFIIDIVGFDAITPLGVAYHVVAGARTTGAASTEIDNESTDDLEEGALKACDEDLLCVGNNAVVRVLGAAGKTITWRAVMSYTFRG